MTAIPVPPPAPTPLPVTATAAIRSAVNGYDSGDPSTWDTLASAGLVIGLDIGQFQDHSAIVMGAAWPQAEGAIGIVEIKRFQLGTPLMQVAEEASALARKANARIVVDLSNNSGFAQLLAPQLGSKPANSLLCAVITNSGTHAAQSTPMPLTIAGKIAAVPRITLSKRELIETVGVELDAGTLRLSKTGDWQELRQELGRLQRIARQSGSVSYQAPLNEHDDLVSALSLCVYGCRRLLPLRRSSGVRKSGAPFSSAAWT